jgi:hypothetical protein
MWIIEVQTAGLLIIIVEQWLKDVEAFHTTRNPANLTNRRSSTNGKSDVSANNDAIM